MSEFYWRTSQVRGGITAREMAARAGRSEDAARSVARRAGVKLQPAQRGHSPATRSRVLRMRAAGMSKADISRATGVAPNTISAWERAE